jgi:hypothetical protein
MSTAALSLLLSVLCTGLKLGEEPHNGDGDRQLQEHFSLVLLLAAESLGVLDSPSQEQDGFEIGDNS